MEAAKAQMKAAQQQMRVNRDKLALRIVRQSLCYGRDKLVALMDKRRVSSVRVRLCVCSGPWKRSYA